MVLATAAYATDSLVLRATQLRAIRLLTSTFSFGGASPKSRRTSHLHSGDQFPKPLDDFSKREPDAELGGEGDAHCRAGTEEVA
jgi:hypothetical protein